MANWTPQGVQTCLQRSPPLYAPSSFQQHYCLCKLHCWTQIIHNPETQKTTNVLAFSQLHRADKTHGNANSFYWLRRIREKEKNRRPLPRDSGKQMQRRGQTLQHNIDLTLFWKPSQSNYPLQLRRSRFLTA